MARRDRSGETIGMVMVFLALTFIGVGIVVTRPLEVRAEGKTLVTVAEGAVTELKGIRQELNGLRSELEKLRNKVGE